MSDNEQSDNLPQPDPKDAQPGEDGMDDSSEAPLIVTDSDVAANEPIPVPDDGLGEWPTNGGPLGCLVGLMVGCVLVGFLGSTLISFVHFAKAGVGGWFITAAVLVVLIGGIVSGAIGWRIGKRFYREYRPTARQVRIAERLQREQ